MIKIYANLRAYSNNLKWCIVSIFFCIVLFHSNLSNEYNLDEYIIEESIVNINKWSDLPNLFLQKFEKVDYRPISVLTFAVEKLLFGEDYRKISQFINILIFWILSFLIYINLNKYLHKRYQILIFFICLLFLCHPIHSSVIATIKNRDGLLSCFWGLLYLLYIQKYLENNKIQFLIISIIFITIGVLSKLDAIGFLLFSIAVLFFNNRETIRKKIIISLFFLILTIALINLKDIILPSSPEVENLKILYTENHLKQTDELFGEIQVIFQTFYLYLKLLFIPAGYYFYYGYNMIPYHSLFSVDIMFCCLSLVLFAYIGWKIKKYNNLAWMGVLWFFATMLFASNVIPVRGIISERYGFIGSIGFCCYLGVVLYELCQWMTNKYYGDENNKDITKYSNVMFVTICTILIFIYSKETIAQSSKWKNTDTLFEADMPHLKNSYEANRIASAKILKDVQNGDNIQKAIKGYQYTQDAITLYDSSMFIHETQLQFLFILKRKEEALLKSKQIIERFDTSIVAWQYVGQHFMEINEVAKAIQAFEKLQQLAPNESSIPKMIARLIYVTQGVDSAINYVNNFPSQYPPYLKNECLGYIYWEIGNIEISNQYFENAIHEGLVDESIAKTLYQFYMNQGKSQEAEKIKKTFLRNFNSINSN